MLPVKALTDHRHSAAQPNLADLWITQGGGPGIQPRPRRGRIVDCVVQRSHQVRLTEAPLADHHDRTPLVRADCLDPFQQIMGRIRDLQEFLGCDLSRAGVRVVGELNGCPFEAFAPKFFS